MKVAIQSEKLVKPKTPTPTHLRRYGLSLFDQIQVPAYIVAVFFYRADGGDDAENVEGKLCRLEESLSEALAIHYPLAGRYVEEGCFVDCNDEGVEFIVGRVDDRLDQILETNPDCPGLDFIELITKTPDHAEHVSPIVTRVYVFECGAFAICFSFSHKVADFSSAIAFLKGWATISRCGITDEASRPSFVVPSMLPPNEQPSVLVSHPEVSISFSEKLVMNRFGFDSVTLAQLASAIANVAKDNAISMNNRPPSRVEIVLGLVWKVLVKIDGWKNNENLRTLAFLTAMNLRGKTGMSTPKNAFGNLCIDAYSEASKEDREMGLHGFVKMVQQTIKDARSKYAGIDNIDEFRAMFEEDCRNIARIRGSSKEKHVVYSTSWCGFGMYEIDFGFGKPELVMTPGPPFRMVVLIDGRIDHGGIDALVILDEVEMAQFKKEIMGYFPKRHG